MIEQLQTFIAPLKHRIMSMIGRCIVSAVQDTNDMQLLKVELRKGEVAEDVEHIQPYGFTSRAKRGAQAVYGAIGGSREDMVVLTVGDARYRLKALAEGEVALYTDEKGVDGTPESIHLKRGKSIEIHSSGEVLVKAPSVKIGNKAQIIAATGVVTQQCVCSITGSPHPQGSLSVKATL